MKQILFLSLLVFFAHGFPPSCSSLAHAQKVENWARESEIVAGTANTFWMNRADCEREGAACLDVTGVDPSAAMIGEIQVDDLTKPIFEPKSNVVTCETEFECNEKRADSKFCPETHFSVTNQVGEEWEAYCTRQIGYGKKPQRAVVVDPAKRAAKEAKRAEDLAKAKAKAEARKARLDALNALKDADLTTLQGLRSAVKLLRDEAVETGADPSLDILILETETKK